MQNEIARSAYEYQRRIESGEKIIVGVNKFGLQKEEPIPVFKVDDSIRVHQVEKLTILKSSRDQQAVKNALEAVRSHAIDGSNIMPSVVNAVEQYCTLGEISDVLRQIFGEFR